MSGPRAPTVAAASAAVAGGFQNQAGGLFATISGGAQRSVIGHYDWQGGGLFETQ